MSNVRGDFEKIFAQCGLTGREQNEAFRALRKLGGENVQIELKPYDLVDALEDAKIWMATKIGEKRINTLNLVNGISDYTLPSDVMEVADVVLPQGTSYGDLEYRQMYASEFEDWRRGVSIGSGPLPLTSYTQERMFQSTLKRTFGNEPTWEFDPSRRILTIRPALFTGIARYEYVAQVVNIERLTLHQLDLMRRYFVAKCKQTLGLVRRKYSEIPMGGSKTGMDGSDLIGDADTEFAMLDEEAKALSMHPGFLIG